MDLLIMGFDKNINRCNICESEIYSDIIISKSLLCQECHEKITNTTVEDFEYNHYKNKIKNWLSRKYKLDMR